MVPVQNPNIVQYNGYVAGWLDSSVENFLAQLPRDCENATYALITCLDSNTEPASLLKKNSHRRVAMPGANALGKGLLLPSKLLNSGGIRSYLFGGFDEIWFFPTNEIAPIPKSASIVGPNRIDQDQLEKLADWMDANGCSLALGDGAGLNIITKAKGLLKYVFAHSLSQPDSTVRMSELWVQDEEKKAPKSKRHRLRGVFHS
jgi:hypothetical protein